MIFPFIRPSWDESHMLVAILAATRTTCLVRAVGAALVKENRVVASGYNGAPSGVTSCLETGECHYKRIADIEHRKNGGELTAIEEGLKYQCLAVHAEANVHTQCAQMGVSMLGCTLYITNFPCPKCAREVIISGKISEVVVWKEYLSNPLLTTDEKRETERLLKQVGVPIRYIKISKARIFCIAILMTLVGDRTKYRFTP